ncbi:phosphoglycerate dehydrogenase [Candidatus Daviesbacteria bacterium]|nr:phosphoglycerate dehydrogenase [Candidatus Daviesbacteria bacterium]
MKKYFIIDFDSTLVSVEALDELANIALAKEAEKVQVVEQIRKITALGMEGKITFPQSLKKRLKLFKLKKEHLDQLVKLLKQNITTSVKRNINFFKSNSTNIYIISGGFREYIVPVVSEILGLNSSQVLANNFIVDRNSNSITLDTTNLLAQENGKVKAVQSLNLDGEIIVIGDGFTDYQIKEVGNADYFYAFVENVHRPSVTAKADRVLASFDDIYEKSSGKILLLENIHPNAKNLLAKSGYQVDLIPHALTKNELKKAIRDINVLGIRSKTNLTRDVLKLAKNLKVVAAFCNGIDQIDLQACYDFGIKVINDPYSNTRSVAELVIGEIIMLFRKVFVKSIKLHQGIWDKSANGSFEVRGKKLGIIGFGIIGQQIATIAESLGMEVYFYDLIDRISLGRSIKCQGLEELLRLADVITVHVNGEKSNEYLISSKQFDLVKQGVIFLNLSRGYIVDLKALASNIKSGQVGGAAIDVFEDEPEKNGQEFKTCLQGLDNVILTPHIAGSTQEAQENIAKYVATKIVDYLKIEKV